MLRFHRIASHKISSFIDDFLKPFEMVILNFAL